jgi:hypothetical protein
MWNALKADFKTAKEQATVAAKDAKRFFEEVKCVCPSCEAVTICPAGEKLFSCSGCGGEMGAPATSNLAKYHGARAMSSMQTSLGRANVGPNCEAMNVVVPPGAEAGKIIQIQAPDGRLFKAMIPIGCTPGQSFVCSIPMHADAHTAPVSTFQFGAGGGAGAGAGSTDGESPQAAVPVAEKIEPSEKAAAVGAPVPGAAFPAQVGIPVAEVVSTKTKD